MKNIIMQRLVKSILIWLLGLLPYVNVYSQNTRIDLANNKYDTSYFRQVLPPDAIKAIKDPELVGLKDALDDTLVNYIKDDDWTLVFEHNGTTKLYPIMPLIWHEVVNDRIDDLEYAVTYCVLTGSAMVFNRKTGENLTKTFGVSGCLYNSNLVMYDYQTRSTWPQLNANCFSGIDLNKDIQQLEFTWARFDHVKTHYPDALILLGGKRMRNFMNMYDRFPFQGLNTYSQNDTLRFPVNFSPGEKFKSKDMFLLIKDKNIAIPFNKLYKFNHHLVNVIGSETGIDCISPCDKQIFNPIYYFAVKAFYPEVELVE